jgi:hypothetical protein
MEALHAVMVVRLKTIRNGDRRAITSNNYHCTTFGLTITMGLLKTNPVDAILE